MEGQSGGAEGLLRLPSLLAQEEKLATLREAEDLLRVRETVRAQEGKRATLRSLYPEDSTLLLFNHATLIRHEGQPYGLRLEQYDQRILMVVWDERMENVLQSVPSLSEAGFIVVDTLEMSLLAVEQITTEAMERSTGRGMRGVIAVDIEIGDKGGTGGAQRGIISLIQISAGQGVAFLFDVLAGGAAMMGALKPLLESDDVVKVLHDCRQDCAALSSQFQVELVRVFDSQVADMVIGARGGGGGGGGGGRWSNKRGLNAVLEDYTGCINPYKDLVEHRPFFWNRRPLSKSMILYAGGDVAFLVQCYHVMLEKLEDQRQQQLQQQQQAEEEEPPAQQGRVKEPLEEVWDYSIENVHQHRRKILTSAAAKAFALELPLNPELLAECGSKKGFYACFTRWRDGLVAQSTQEGGGALPAGEGEEDRETVRWWCVVQPARALQILFKRKYVISRGKLNNTLEWRLAESGAAGGGGAPSLTSTWRGQQQQEEEHHHQGGTDGPGGARAKNRLGQEVGRQGPKSELEANKGSVIVGSVGDWGDVNWQNQVIFEPGVRHFQDVTVTNTGSPCSWNKCLPTRPGSLKLSIRSGDGVAEGEDVQLPVVLGQGQSMTVRMEYDAREDTAQGMFRCMLLFLFSPSASSSAVDGEVAAAAGVGFMIGRSICLNVIDEDAHSLLKGDGGGKAGRKKALFHQQGAIIPAGSRREGRVKPKFVHKLLKYLPDAQWQDQMQLGGNAAEMMADMELKASNHPVFFERLLWLEERQMQFDMATFDEVGVTLAPTPSGRLFRLTVPGLAEGRPSVLQDDVVLVTKGSATFEGIAINLQRDSVDLKFNRKFRYSPGEKVDVRFLLRRTEFRLCHQGLANARKLPRSWLFPEPGDDEVTDGSGGIAAADGPVVRLEVDSEGELPTLGRQRLNREQQRAVRAIAERRQVQVPYILFGPPGTGKTVTLVEAVLHVLQKRPSDKILLLCPTNAACDLLVERLSSSDAALVSPKTDLLRVMAFSRGVRTVSSVVHNFCKTSVDGEQFISPSLADIKSFQVVVSTLTSAGKLFNLGLPRGYFGLIAVDEAGQATEPQILAAVGAMGGKATQLVLAGDHKQLSPIVFSALAQEYGLANSYLERLMGRAVYAKGEGEEEEGSEGERGERVERVERAGGYNPTMVTKLLHNYRSHPAILEVPNELFYESELVPSAQHQVSHCLDQWEALPQPGVPLLFHGINGLDQKDSSSPSWFNPDEVCAVAEHVVQMIQCEGVKEGDIGVITPYGKQRQKIKTLLRAKGIAEGHSSRDSDEGEGSGVKVGSVEEFQGQERKVIIISTVRSTHSVVDFDTEHSLGFVSNPKRFNVAITRAQALLIVVGSPEVLAVDPCWGKLLSFCVQRGCYKGVELPPTVVVQAGIQGGEAGVVSSEAAGEQGREGGSEELSRVESSTLLIARLLGGLMGEPSSIEGLFAEMSGGGGEGGGGGGGGGGEGGGGVDETEGEDDDDDEEGEKGDEEVGEEEWEVVQVP